jgi:uncharacterized protein
MSATEGGLRSVSLSAKIIFFKELLDSIGLPEYGLICERHVGVGISLNDIKNFNLPLPERDMLPVSIEEQLICYADKFFSKNGNGQKMNGTKSIEQIVQSLQPYGQDKVERFQKRVEMITSATAGIPFVSPSNLLR